MSEHTDDVPNHPDWFDAGTAADDHPLATDFDPEGANWFDDPSHLDPTPGDVSTATGSEGASTDSADSAAGAATASGESGTTAGSATATGGSAVGTGSGTGGSGTTAARGPGGASDERGARVYRDEQGRQVRQPAEPEEEDSGGIIAWLKRLFRLN